MSPSLPWERILTEWKKAKFGRKGGDPLLFKNFVINYLGESYTRVKREAAWESFKARASDYSLGTAPSVDHGWLLYAGADIQGDRIEVGVFGLYYGLELALVDFKRFYGDPAKIDDKSWSALREFIRDKTYQIQGRPRSILKCGVDCGWDPKHKRYKDWTSKNNTVVSFCATTAGLCVPVKGIPDPRDVTSDVIMSARTHNDSLTTRYNVNTSVIKDMLYTNLDLTEGPGTIHFPKFGDLSTGVPLGDHYFKSFLSESYKEDKNGRLNWVPHYARNEVLDVAVYAVAMYYSDGMNEQERPFFEYLDQG
jgi:phage terminase large subunit GpA-like protein